MRHRPLLNSPRCATQASAPFTYHGRLAFTIAPQCNVE